MKVAGSFDNVYQRISDANERLMLRLLLIGSTPGSAAREGHLQKIRGFLKLGFVFGVSRFSHLGAFMSKETDRK